MAFLRYSTLDAALQDLIDNVDRVYLCSQEPTTFAEATSTYAVGFKAGTIGAQEDAPGGGRQASFPAFVDGTGVDDDDATHWAFVDFVNEVLYATNSLSNPLTIADGQPFASSAIPVRLPDAVSL